MSISANLIPKEMVVPEMGNIKTPGFTQDPMLIYSTSDKQVSQSIPDSPPTMFISANSSPGCNIVNERDDSYSNLCNFYSIFSKISEEMKNREIVSSCYLPNGESVVSSSTGIETGLPLCNPTAGAQLLPPSLVTNSQAGNASGFCSLAMDEGSLRPNLDSSNCLSSFSGSSQLEFNNAVNAYYQQLALYNQMVLAMYSPMLANGYGVTGTSASTSAAAATSAATGCPNAILSQMCPGWQCNNATSSGSGAAPAATAYNLFDLQNMGQQTPNMLYLTSLSQIPCSGAGIGSGTLTASLPPTPNLIINSGVHSNMQSINPTGGVSNSNISVNSSPVHSSQSIPSSMLSPVSSSQSSNPRSALSNFNGGGFEISKSLGDWASKICLRQDGRKTEKTRKSVKSGAGGRRKIDKSSAVCIVCGTTQTSQWRFLNLGELYASNREEHSPSLKQESNSASNGHSDQVSSAPDTGSSPPVAYVDKQICCNACYMKYDRNRPRYRNGKKVPPPLPQYLYSQNNQFAATAKPGAADSHSRCKQEASYVQSEC